MLLKSPTDKPVHVALTNGCAISIGPEGREVPVMFRKDAFINGAIPVGTTAEDMTAEKAAPTGKSDMDILRVALRKMREDGFDPTGAGLPDIRQVRKAAGFNVSAIQLTDAWNSLE